MKVVDVFSNQLTNLKLFKVKVSTPQWSLLSPLAVFPVVGVATIENTAVVNGVANVWVSVVCPNDDDTPHWIINPPGNFWYPEVPTKSWLLPVKLVV